jgi:hypothetical protein
MLSLAILLFSITAIAQLIRFGSERARDVDDQSIGTTLCQRKLSELAIGTVPLSNSTYQPLGDEGWDNWEWKVQADTLDSNTGVYEVQVFIRHNREDDTTFETHMTQMILDPSKRGSNQDPPANPPPSTTTTGNGN